MGSGRTSREQSGRDVVIGAQQRALVIPRQGRGIPAADQPGALPVSGNQDKDKLSLRSPEHHLSVNLAHAFSGVPSQLLSLRPEA